MNVAIFNTEAEAEIMQASFLVDYLAVHNEEPFKTQTTKWDTPKLRNDGKWSIAECDHSDVSGLTVIEYDSNYYTEAVE